MVRVLEKVLVVALMLVLQLVLPPTVHVLHRSEPILVFASASPLTGRVVFARRCWISAPVVVTFAAVANLRQVGMRRVAIPILLTIPQTTTNMLSTLRTTVVTPTVAASSYTNSFRSSGGCGRGTR